jgi:hypothetical protein
MRNPGPTSAATLQLEFRVVMEEQLMNEQISGSDVHTHYKI